MTWTTENPPAGATVLKRISVDPYKLAMDPSHGEALHKIVAAIPAVNAPVNPAESNGTIWSAGEVSAGALLRAASSSNRMLVVYADRALHTIGRGHYRP